MDKQYYKYVVVMMLCFLLGGFALMLYFLQLYSILWQPDMVASVRIRDNPMQVPVFASDVNSSNSSRLDRMFVVGSSSGLLYSPFSIILLFIGVVTMLSGFSIWNLIREREINHTKKSVIGMLLLPDEKRVIEELEIYGGSATQSEISKDLGLSRVKIHRIIRSLESKNLVTKNVYGMTNKITLKK